MAEGRGIEDIVIVSAFGRGNWMAAAVAAQGLKVTLVDVSEALGRWAPEDWEGPLGFFMSEKLAPSQLARMNEEDDYESVDEGFTLWLKSGPLDLKGHLSNHWLKTNPALATAQSYLTEFDGFNFEDFKRWAEKIESMGFVGSWLIHLAHHLGARVFTDNAQAFKQGRPLPLFAPWALRRVTRKGAQRSLDWVESQGARVYRSAQLMDIRLEGKLFQGLEIKSPSLSGVVLADQLLWMLTSEESFHVSEPLGALLFPKGPIQYEWSWIRFRVAMELGEYLHTLPPKLVMVEELYLPWTHSNLLVVDRTVNLQDVDVWMRVPNHLRFQRAYLDNCLEQILKTLADRIPHSNPKKVEMPQEYHYAQGELGPSRHGLYSPEALEKLRPLKLKNALYDGPEFWPALDWTSRFVAQQKAMQALLQRVEQLKSAQGGPHDRALHPS